MNGGGMNFVHGDMSIIGTRPPLISETNFYELHHRARLAIKPGITGMWQVSGRSNITDFEEVVKLDKQYISEWTMLVIDSEKLSQQIHETELDYMEKSKEVLANGQETEGAKYQKKVLNWKKRLYYGVLRIVIRPLRQLL